MNGRDLSTRESDLLAACLHHRILTPIQLHQLIAPDLALQTVRKFTRELRAGELLDSVPVRRVRTGGGHERLWFATPAGRAIAEPLVQARHHVVTAEIAANSLQQHTLAGNDVACAFVRHARELGHHCGPFDIDHEVGHELPRTRHGRQFVVPDLLVRCWLREADGDDLLLTRFVEIDRAQYAPHQLADKIAVYTRYLLATAETPGGRQPLWALKYPIFPKVLVVFADQSADAVRRRVDVVYDLCRTRATTAAGLDRLGPYCASLADVLDAGPYAPIWRTPAHDGLVDLVGRR